MDGRTEELLVNNMWQCSMNSFLGLIREMNRMYELPVNNTPAANMNLAEQLQNFKKILSNEIAEIDDIILNPEHAADIRSKMAAENIDEVVLDAHVALADLLADIVVYCFSESIKHGIYLPAVLHYVMASNFSKLDENGQPIKDKDGKFLKGPNYKPPEDAIKQFLPVMWASPPTSALHGGDNESVH